MRTKEELQCEYYKLMRQYKQARPRSINRELYAAQLAALDWAMNQHGVTLYSEHDISTHWDQRAIDGVERANNVTVEPCRPLRSGFTLILSYTGRNIQIHYDGRQYNCPGPMNRCEVCAMTGIADEGLRWLESTWNTAVTELDDEKIDIRAESEEAFKSYVRSNESLLGKIQVKKRDIETQQRNLEASIERIELRVLERMAENTASEIADRVPACLDGLNLFAFDSYSGMSCVYFLCLNKTVVYVGETTSLGQRISDHYRSGKCFDDVFAMLVPSKSRKKVEREWIYRLKPKYNSEWHHLVA